MATILSLNLIGIICVSKIYVREVNYWTIISLLIYKLYFDYSISVRLSYVWSFIFQGMCVICTKSVY